jgi:hypothetical protein
MMKRRRKKKQEEVDRTRLAFFFFFYERGMAIAEEKIGACSASERAMPFIQQACAVTTGLP